MGLIYIIKCSETSKVYIGQTIQTLKYRWHGHKSSAQRYLRYKNGELDKKPFSCSKLCRAMNKYGIDTFRIEALEEIEAELLNDREKYYIALHDSVKNGYNITVGGQATYTEELRKRMSDLNSKNMETIYERFRVHNDMLNGLPIYCIHLTKRGGEGYAINKHPQCQHKEFMMKKYGTLEKAKDALIDYYNQLESGKIVKPKQVKCDTDLPKGIRRFKNRYLVNKTVNGKQYTSSFSKKMTDVENLQDAIKYLNSLNPQAEQYIPEKDLLDEFNDWLNEDLSNYVPDNPIPISN